MKFTLFILLISSFAFALTEKVKEPETPPEVIIESTKEKSKLPQLEIDKPVVLHHREPVLFPDGRVIEVHYFSHKRPRPDEAVRASVGLKLSDGKAVELVILNQDLDKNGKETLSSAATKDHKIKLLKMVYDDQITVEITAK